MYDSLAPVVSKSGVAVSELFNTIDGPVVWTQEYVNGSPSRSELPEPSRFTVAEWVSDN